MISVIQYMSESQAWERRLPRLYDKAEDNSNLEHSVNKLSMNKGLKESKYLASSFVGNKYTPSLSTHHVVSDSPFRPTYTVTPNMIKTGQYGVRRGENRLLSDKKPNLP